MDAASARLKNMVALLYHIYDWIIRKNALVGYQVNCIIHLYKTSKEKSLECAQFGWVASCILINIYLCHSSLCPILSPRSAQASSEFVASAMGVCFGSSLN